ncbi:MAG: hypothetical protein ACYDCK_13880 [Thermoplasmatota archaeon]
MLGALSPCSHGSEASLIQIEQINGPAALTLCAQCLQSAMLMEASRDDEHGARALCERAATEGLTVWRAPHAIYLCPGGPPFGAAQEKTAD